MGRDGVHVRNPSVHIVVTCTKTSLRMVPSSVRWSPFSNGWKDRFGARLAPRTTTPIPSGACGRASRMKCRQRRAAFTVGKSATHPLRNWWLDVTVQNPEAVPNTGGAIIAANHLSFIDSMLLMYGLGRPVSFLGKVEYLDSFATRHLFPASE